RIVNEAVNLPNSRKRLQLHIARSPFFMTSQFFTVLIFECSYHKHVEISIDLRLSAVHVTADQVTATEIFCAVLIAHEQVCHCQFFTCCKLFFSRVGFRVEHIAEYDHNYCYIHALSNRFFQITVNLLLFRKSAIPIKTGNDNNDRIGICFSLQQNNKRTYPLPLIQTHGKIIKRNRSFTNLEKPRYQNYAALQVRISSFQGWPSYLDQTPREMAIAGFLFAGYHDYTRCFFCGGGLRNWEAGDDPWVEHARWFPKCTYLRQNKGDAFIKAVQDKHEQMDKSDQITSKQHVQSKETTQNGSNLLSHSNPQSSSTSYLDTAAARSVLEMGYTREQALRVIQQLLRDKPGGTFTALDIMTILLEKDENLPNGSTGSTSVNSTNTSGTSTNALLLNTNTYENEAHEPLANSLNESNLDDAELLVEENRQLRDQRLCKICLELDASIAFLPCGHLVCCSDCAPAMRKCPICRTYVKGTPCGVIVNTVYYRVIFNTVYYRKADVDLRYWTIKDILTRSSFLVNSHCDKTCHVIKENPFRTWYENWIRNDNEQLQQNLHTAMALSEENEAEKIYEENRQLKEQKLCKVCLDLDASFVFLPCGHIVCCKDCAPAMRNCPICRKYIEGTVKTYLA
ncbi:baculoviral IAP repeat-containing protein 7/8, partial [Mytilus galloprovincialis]